MPTAAICLSVTAGGGRSWVFMYVLAGRQREMGLGPARLPLTTRATEILKEMETVRVSAFVFPGSTRDASLSNMALAMTLRRLGAGVTAHGFRSTFRDWASERTSFPGDVAEMALAHAISDKTEAAYRRGDLFEKRRALMDAWADFLGLAKADLKVVTRSARQPITARVDRGSSEGRYRGHCCRYACPISAR